MRKRQEQRLVLIARKSAQAELEEEHKAEIEAQRREAERNRR